MGRELAKELAREPGTTEAFKALKTLKAYKI